MNIILNKKKTNCKTDIYTGGDGNCANDWRTECKSIINRTSFLFNNKLYADTEFLFNVDATMKSIPSHKFILMISSFKFENLLNNNDDDATSSATATDDDNDDDEDNDSGNQNDTDENDDEIKQIKIKRKINKILISDISYAGFLEMLRYIYCDYLNLNMDIIGDVLYGSRKFQLNNLLTNCLTFVQNQINAENLFKIYTRLNCDANASDIVFNYIENYTKDILKSTEFLNFNLAQLEILLKRNTLEINELELFKAIDRWAENKCKLLSLLINGENKRKVITSALLKLIRFPTMSPQEFNYCMIIESDYLSDQEQLTILKYCCLGFSENIDFPTTIRQLSQRNLKYCTIVDDNSQPIIFYCDTEWINVSFITNSSILLFSLSLYGKYMANNTNNFNINNSTAGIDYKANTNSCYITITYNNIKYFNDIIHFRNDGSIPEKINLLKPILLKAGNWCTIIIKYHNLKTTPLSAIAATTTTTTSSTTSTTAVLPPYETIGDIYKGKLMKPKILLDDNVIFQFKNAGTVYEIFYKLDN